MVIIILLCNTQRDIDTVTLQAVEQTGTHILVLLESETGESWTKLKLRCSVIAVVPSIAISKAVIRASNSTQLNWQRRSSKSWGQLRNYEHIQNQLSLVQFSSVGCSDDALRRYRCHCSIFRYRATIVRNGFQANHVSSWCGDFWLIPPTCPCNSNPIPLLVNEAP